MIGTILGNRYELLEKIGEGGMAIVYKARCNLLNRFVSVKILKDEFSKDKDFVDRFKSEALAVASLSQNNIVNIYDVGSQDSINYIVMEYIQGKTLKQVIIESGRLEYTRVINIAIQICKALECAHKNNIVHRDIKPHNILLTEEGIIKVTDFGIAKAANSSTLTNTNKVMGSAHYISPEQAKGAIVDYRTDIYSFGIVLFEMITGKVPFDAETTVTVALKHIQDPITPPIELNKYMPLSLNNLIMKATEKETFKRYQSVKDLRLDLEMIKDNPETIILLNSLTSEHTTIMDPITAAQLKKLDEISPKVVKKTMPKKVKLISLSVIGFIFLVLIGILGAKACSSVGTSKEILVPDIVGKTEAEATTIVTGKNLKLLVAGEEKSDALVGTIISQSPKKDVKTLKDSEVRVVISSGGRETTVFSYLNIDIEQAKTMITNAGLTLGTVTPEFSEDVPSGVVMRQSPDPDTVATKDTVINLVVSKGPEVKYAKVPDLTDMNIGEVNQILINNKLKIGNLRPIMVTDLTKVGKVVAQNPIAGTLKVIEGSTVEVSYNVYLTPNITDYATVGSLRASLPDEILVKYVFGAAQVNLDSKTPIDKENFKQSPAAGTALGTDKTITITIPSA
ncbi:MAG TPA: Stk1 family PASTA domain-containing Ser/Thr kinase [Clostridiaceae bacterium]